MLKLQFDVSEEIFERVNPASREEWLKERGKGLGGSDASCIIGKNKWKTNVDLYQEKIGVVEQDKSIDEKPQVIYGRFAEEHIRELFKLRHKDKYNVEHFENQNLISKEYPFLRASLDGEITDLETNKKGILEIKTANIMSTYKLEDWKGNHVPDNYYCQLLHYFIVTGYQFAILVAELERTSQDGAAIFTRKEYYFDRKECQADIEYLLKAEIEFWNENVLKEKLPNLKITLGDL